MTVLGMCLGLSSVACATLAPLDDFAAYRVYRYEAQGPDRLAAGSAYLQRFPRGRFHPEVSREVLGAEEDYWQEHRSSPDGLREYLLAFPSGPHVEEAHQRQGVFEAARRQQQTDRLAAQAAAQQRANEEHSAQAERNRVLTRIHFSHWLSVLGGLQGWGQGMGAIAQSNPDFNTEFQGDPPGTCRGAHCRKNYRQDFNIPVPGRTAQGAAVLFTVDLVRTGPAENRVLGQAGLVVHNRGLSHWWECEHQQPLDATDAAARESAVAWSMLALRAATTVLFPTARETPAALYGPPPEPVMQGIDEEETQDAAPVDPNACVIPSQPFGTRWSAVVGCEGISSNPLASSTQALEEQSTAFGAANLPQPVTPHSCLRIDAYAALDAEGMSTDEGVLLSLIPACALAPPAPPTRPVRPVRPVRPTGPVRPARPTAPARPPVH